MDHLNDSGKVEKRKLPKLHNGNVSPMFLPTELRHPATSYQVIYKYLKKTENNKLCSILSIRAPYRDNGEFKQFPRFHVIWLRCVIGDCIRHHFAEIVIALSSTGRQQIGYLKACVMGDINLP